MSEPRDLCKVRYHQMDDQIFELDMLHESQPNSYRIASLSKGPNYIPPFTTGVPIFAWIFAQTIPCKKNFKRKLCPLCELTLQMRDECSKKYNWIY